MVIMLNNKLKLNNFLKKKLPYINKVMMMMMMMIGNHFIFWQSEI